MRKLFPGLFSARSHCLYSWYTTEMSSKLCRPAECITSATSASLYEDARVKSFCTEKKRSQLPCTVDDRLFHRPDIRGIECARTLRTLNMLSEILYSARLMSSLTCGHPFNIWITPEWLQRLAANEGTLSDAMIHIKHFTWHRLQELRMRKGGQLSIASGQDGDAFNHLTRRELVNPCHISYNPPWRFASPFRVPYYSCLARIDPAAGDSMV